MVVDPGRLATILSRDDRYAPEAYQFLVDALEFTQHRLGKPVAKPGFLSLPSHVSGAELVAGVAELALAQFGMMAHVVFKLWGVRNSSDIGAITFNLIEVGELTKNESDRIEDFANLQEFNADWAATYAINLDNLTPVRRSMS